MGLDCFPRRYPLVTVPSVPPVPDDQTHPDGEPCPFSGDDFPVGMMGTCCSLRGEVAVRELEALDEYALSEDMHRNMVSYEATEFADALRGAADALERRYAVSPEKPRGAGWNGTWSTERKDWDWQNYSTFEQALAAIREAARWYEKVGSLGYGVFAWH
jgi:hypothetical protein